MTPIDSERPNEAVRPNVARRFVDLLLANGHPDDMIENYSTQVKYKEPLLLFHNDGKKLTDVSRGAGPAFAHSYPARGLAVAPWGGLQWAIYLLAATAWFTVGQRIWSVRAQLRARP